MSNILSEILGKRFSLKNHGINDIAAIWDLDKLFENKDKIIEYYTSRSRKIETFDDFIDFLAIRRLVHFEEFLENIAEDKREEIKGFFDVLKYISGEYQTKDIVSFLNEKIELIFQKRREYVRIEQTALELVLRYKHSIKEEAFQKICDAGPFYLLDVYPNLGSVTKKIPVKKILFNEKTIPILIRDRLDFLLNELKNLPDDEAKEPIDILVELLKPILSEKDLETRFRNIDLIEKTYKFLKEKKDSRAEIFLKYVDKKEDIIREWVKNNGQKYGYNIKMAECVDAFRSKERSPFAKYFSLTHGFNEKTRISNLNVGPGEANIADLFNDMDPKDDFFTNGHKRFLQDHLDFYSTLMMNFLSYEEIFSEYSTVMIIFVERICNAIGCSDDIVKDVELMFYSIDVVNNDWDNNSFIFPTLYGCTSYICAQIETILREVAYKFRNNGQNFVDVRELALAELLKEETIIDMIGEDFCRNIRFYLSKLNNIGKNKRNNLIHWKDIRPNEVNLHLICELLYIFSQIVNSILYNIIPNEDNAQDKDHCSPQLPNLQ